MKHSFFNTRKIITYSTEVFNQTVCEFERSQSVNLSMVELKYQKVDRGRKFFIPVLVGRRT